MGKSPSQFEETIQHQFDRLCKLALKGEKIDYIRHMEYLRKNEVMLSELCFVTMLCTVLPELKKMEG